MPSDNKITEIMQLAGVAPGDFERARQNYVDLNEDEIDLRLGKLRRGAAAVAEWRAEEDRRKVTAVQRSWKELWDEIKGRVKDILDEGAAQPGWVLARAPALQFARQLNAWGGVDRPYAGLTHRLNAWTGQPYFSDSFLGNLSNCIGKIVAGTGDSKIDEFVLPRLQAIASSDEKAAALAMYQLNEFFNHPFMPEENPLLTANATVDALARVENVIDALKPDVIVAVNEGNVIGSLVVQHLNLHTPIVHVQETPETGIRWIDDRAMLASAQTVCVMGHFARSGDTLRKTMDMTRANCHAGRIYGAVLASSVDAVGKLGDCTYHHLVGGSKIDLTFDPSKGMKVENDTFILGGKSSVAQTNLPITRDELDRSRDNMRRLYPVDASFPTNVSTTATAAFEQQS
jgi:hypothetical protein